MIVGGYLSIKLTYFVDFLGTIIKIKPSKKTREAVIADVSCDEDDLSSVPTSTPLKAQGKLLRFLWLIVDRDIRFWFVVTF